MTTATAPSAASLPRPQAGSWRTAPGGHSIPKDAPPQRRGKLDVQVSVSLTAEPLDFREWARQYVAAVIAREAGANPPPLTSR